MARGLQRLGHHIVAVITLSDGLNHDDRDLGYPVLRLPRFRSRPLRWIQTLRCIRCAARRADVVYLNGLVLEGVLATKVVGHRPVVIKVVGDLIWEKARNNGATSMELDIFQTARLSVRWRLLRRLQAWYTSRADAVIVPSSYLANIVQGWGVDEAHIHILTNAVSLPQREPSTRPPCYDLVTVARLVPWKGLSVLVRLAGEHGWSLRIVGDGPMRSELETLATTCAARVSFAGHVPREQIPDEIRGARLFVLNSSYEGLPHVVLEAKAAGVAVLATDAGGTPEIIRHGLNGWLTPVGSTSALTEGIKHLLANELDRKRLAEAGWHQIAEEYSFDSLVGFTADVLTQACR